MTPMSNPQLIKKLKAEIKGWQKAHREANTSSSANYCNGVIHGLALAIQFNREVKTCKKK